jgi:hypothetical protein
LVGRYPTNYLIRRGPLRQRNSFALRPYTVLAAVSRGCPVLPGRFPRVTHPCATRGRSHAFDLHVLGMPPAFVLSQDQTLMFIPSPAETRKGHTEFRSLAHLVTSSDRDAPHARLTKRPTPMPQHQSQTPRPAARASLPRPIHSVKQLTRRRGGTPSPRPWEPLKADPHLNEGTRLIRPSSSCVNGLFQPASSLLWRAFREPAEAAGGP